VSRPIKAYVMTTGAVFALLAIAHVWRLFEEGLQVAAGPWFLVTTVLAVGLSLWALRLLRMSARPQQE
jgi:hypothetical protein